MKKLHQARWLLAGILVSNCLMEISVMTLIQIMQWWGPVLPWVFLGQSVVIVLGIVVLYITRERVE